ncbi:rna binding protein, putative [Theileria annulata]|uniref:Rna binding protein, putative n=1 Tax=Theileria annulata TaxID=5874 RepID=Q4UDL3_THEAN|nr:rna binding protein, putative [Theileria annulata]CAI74826.1 rna binding protein, putative [Theileria annulata]|eukprot:XP_952558.1 rna binding protein, putative [Theileria annulata]
MTTQSPGTVDGDKSEKTVKVSNLPLIFDESDLQILFANVGKIVDCLLTKSPGEPTNSSIIEFSTVDEAILAVSLSGVSVRRHILRIEYSKQPISKPETAESHVSSDDIKGKIAKVLEIRDMINKRLSSKSSSSTDKTSESSSSETFNPEDSQTVNRKHRKTTRFDCKTPNSVRTITDL